jgi:formyl-CoA transferase
VQTSLLQAQIALLDFQAARFLVDGKVPRQTGNDHPTAVPMGVFETSDGHVNLAPVGQPMYERLCRALDRPEWITDPRFADPRQRGRNRAEMNAVIAERMREGTSAHWVERLNAAGVACGPIYNIDQVFSDPQVQHLGIAQSVKKRDKSTMHVVGQPIIMSRTKSKMAAPPPEIGQHTNEVLKEFGFSAKDIAALHKAKAV